MKVLIILALTVFLEASAFVCRSSGSFGSSGIQIPDSRVNDGYCDCEDGSDETETHVCNSGSFVCKTELTDEGYTKFVDFMLSVLRSISNMFVNDGICDCCDCSYKLVISFRCRDESEALRQNWTNACMEKNTMVLKRIVEDYKGKKAGLAISQDTKSKKNLFKKIKSSITAMTKVKTKCTYND